MTHNVTSHTHHTTHMYTPHHTCGMWHSHAHTTTHMHTQIICIQTHSSAVSTDNTACTCRISSHGQQHTLHGHGHRQGHKEDQDLQKERRSYLHATQEASRKYCSALDYITQWGDGCVLIPPGQESYLGCLDIASLQKNAAVN